MSKTEKEKRAREGEGGRKGGRREREGAASSPEAASKPPRLRIPLLSMKRSVIKWVCGGKTMKERQSCL